MINQDNLVRQKFLLGLSLSEISFIYFIIILLVSLTYISDYKKKNERLKTKNQEISDKIKIYIIDSEARIAVLEERLGLSKEESKRSLNARTMDVRKIRNEMNILKIDREKLEKINKKREKLKLDNMSLIVILEEFSEIMRQLELYGSVNDTVDDKISDLLASSNKQAQQKIIIENLKNDFKEYKENKLDKKVEGDRHGPPPCFFQFNEKSNYADKKSSDYMYIVSIHVKDYELKKAWLPKDQKSMEDIWQSMAKHGDIYKKSNALSNEKFRLNKEEFKRFGAIIFKHAEENNCKHHVKLCDKISNKKNVTVDELKALAPNRLIVENYFYKKEESLESKACIN
jgi:hypothetical protein